MAVKQPVTSIVPRGGSPGMPSGAPTTVMTQWTGIGDADTCQGVQCPGFPDQTIEVSGTFAGATIQILGSNSSVDGTVGSGRWFVLSDPLGTGNPIQFSAEGLKTLLHNPLWIRPATAGGAGSSLNVYLVSKAQSA
jgi:hypothetical protein